jgi:hypothetical protein
MTFLQKFQQSYEEDANISAVMTPKRKKTLLLPTRGMTDLCNLYADESTTNTQHTALGSSNYPVADADSPSPERRP